MMKRRLPLLVSFVLFVALCASGAYWGMQLFTPKPRPQLAPPPPSGPAELNIAAAGALFGGNLVVATASNYTLKGVVSARGGLAGVAVLSADGKPAVAVGVGEEISPGVSLKEVHPQYVLLSEGGMMKRVDLPEGGKGSARLDGLNFAPETGQPGAPGMMGGHQQGGLTMGATQQPIPPNAAPSPQQMPQHPTMPGMMAGANPANLVPNPPQPGAENSNGPVEPGPQTGTVVEPANVQK